ncbi:hypothetical protein ACFP1Z_12385 [Streptomyces gamaensis]|uniref:Uncharacterized protein n=1 Tax=Streptomyces gamaensis TaxID=1763542 RepID=A0ABW0YWN0_9ACTN
MEHGSQEDAMGSGAASVGTTVRDVVRDVVSEVAPEELPLVTALFRFDDATVVRRLGRTGGRREPLGFGLGEVATMVAPVVWLVLDEAARKLAGAAVDGAAAKGKTALRKVLRTRRRQPPVAVPALTREQLADIQARVLETAARRGLDSARAEAIADAVVARLALTVGEAPAPRPGVQDRRRPQG